MTAGKSPANMDSQRTFIRNIIAVSSRSMNSDRQYLSVVHQISEGSREIQSGAFSIGSRWNLPGPEEKGARKLTNTARNPAQAQHPCLL